MLPFSFERDEVDGAAGFVAALLWTGSLSADINDRQSGEASMGVSRQP